MNCFANSGTKRSIPANIEYGPYSYFLANTTISCDYLRCRAITIRLHWINSLDRFIHLDLYS